MKGITTTEKKNARLVDGLHLKILFVFVEVMVLPGDEGHAPRDYLLCTFCGD